ncbi:hypothetical protein TNCT_171051 [Trichonephila clavata]|uniref:Secreted protein n=1 Tax=Trichonephila clavata TaxID=2740835 RepID=A0A8X6I0G6_TRICU|nr:hypothetical protein TNCT_171051 [Trichonephila clavata]
MSISHNCTTISHIYWLSFAIWLAISSSSSFHCEKTSPSNDRVFARTLLIYRQQLSHTLLAVLQTDVNSALLSSILPTRISCARESSLMKAFCAFSYAAIASAEASAGNLGHSDLHKQHHEHCDVATRVQFAVPFTPICSSTSFQYEL